MELIAWSLLATGAIAAIVVAVIVLRRRHNERIGKDYAEQEQTEIESGIKHAERLFAQLKIALAERSTPPELTDKITALILDYLSQAKHHLATDRFMSARVALDSAMWQCEQACNALGRPDLMTCEWGEEDLSASG